MPTPNPKKRTFGGTEHLPVYPLRPEPKPKPETLEDQYPIKPLHVLSRTGPLDKVTLYLQQRGHPAGEIPEGRRLKPSTKKMEEGRKLYESAPSHIKTAMGFDATRAAALYGGGRIATRPVRAGTMHVTPVFDPKTGKKIAWEENREEAGKKIRVYREQQVLLGGGRDTTRADVAMKKLSETPSPKEPEPSIGEGFKAPTSVWEQSAKLKPEEEKEKLKQQALTNLPSPKIQFKSLTAINKSITVFWTSAIGKL